jgi:hypothetical protein
LDWTAILPGLLVFLGVTGALSLVTGMGLRRYAAWSRNLGLGLAVLDLPIPPFGTALGVYSLMLLPKANIKAVFDAGDAVPPRRRTDAHSA